MKRLELVLPFPVSANRYWQITGRNRMSKTQEAKQYIAEVAFEVSKARGAHFFEKGEEISLAIIANYPVRPGPDMDLDNCLKVLIDALETASVYPNDDQIRHLQITRESMHPRGQVRCILFKIERGLHVRTETCSVIGVHEETE